MIGLISVPLSDQSLSERNHLGNVLGRHGFDRRWKRIERRHILTVFLGELSAHLFDTDTLLLGCLNDFIVDIRDIACITDTGIPRLQQSIKAVKDHNGPGIAYVGIVVDRGAADVHRNALCVLRREDLLLARQRVVKPQLIHWIRTNYRASQSSY